VQSPERTTTQKTLRGEETKREFSLSGQIYINKYNLGQGWQSLEFLSVTKIVKIEEKEINATPHMERKQGFMKNQSYN